MAVIGSYAVVKGEISEKLAFRLGASLGPKQPVATRWSAPRLPRGLDDPRWDFSPKEETDRIPIRNWRIRRAPDRRQMVGGAVLAVRGHDRLGHRAPAVYPWPLPGSRSRDDGEVERRLLAGFRGRVRPRPGAAQCACWAISRAATSCRSCTPRCRGRRRAAFVCARGIAVKLRLSPRFARNAGIVAGCLLVAASIVVQMQPNHLNHLSRWGHWAAGQWLAGHADPTEMVLDTRGWARFVSGHPGYDYWHVRQALTDSHLSYIIVGLDELEAEELACQDAERAARVRGDSAQRIPRLPRRSNGRRSTLPLPPARHLGRTGPVSYGSLWQRWSRGVSWTWINERYRARVPDDLAAT